MNTDRPRAGMMFRVAGVAPVIFLTTLSLHAAETSSDAPDLAFKALLIDGRELSGRILSITGTSVTVATREGRKEVLPYDRLVKLTRESPIGVVGGDVSHSVLLGDGDRLTRASIGTATDSTLEVQSELLGKLEIPLNALVGLVLAPPSPAAESAMITEKVLFEPRKAEVVWLANGDRLGGSFLGLDERNVKLEVEKKPMEIDRSEVVAVGFDPNLLDYPLPKEPFLEASFSDGTRIGITAIHQVEGNVEAKTRFGQPVRFSMAELTKLHARSQSLEYLSDRKPAQARYEEYVGPTLPYRLNRAVDGQPFRLGGQTFDRGIGTQSRTFLAYRIGPKDRRFQATVGVDERAGPLGSVVFRVFVDRDERFKSPPMSSRDLPRALDIDLAGGKILILVTEFGERGNVRDLADWVEARMIR